MNPREQSVESNVCGLKITSTAIAATAITCITGTASLPPSPLSSSKAVTTTTTTHSSNNSSTLSTTITSPTQVDVLCGRGPAASRHQGNVSFRALVESKKFVYQSSNLQKVEKKDFAKSIVAIVKNQGGRFLRKMPKPQKKPSPSYKSNNNNARMIEKDHWVEIDDEDATAKTLQALRERVKTKPKKSKTSESGVLISLPQKPSPIISKSKSKSKSKPKRSNTFSGGPCASFRAPNHCGDTRESVENEAIPGMARGIFRETFSVPNGPIGPFTLTSSSLEWELFDFGDDEETNNQGDPPLARRSLVHIPSWSAPIPHPPPDHHHDDTSGLSATDLEGMLSTSRLYGTSIHEPLALPYHASSPRRILAPYR